jgi:hypothetical protein
MDMDNMETSFMAQLRFDAPRNKFDEGSLKINTAGD